MKNWYLLKYRLNHNDIDIKNKIKLFSLLFIGGIGIILFYTLEPLSKLQNLLLNKDIKILACQEIATMTPSYEINQTSPITLPISGTITSPYGYRTDPISGSYSKHTGIDISGIHHDQVRTIEDGIVTFAGSQSGYGNCVEIKHTNYYSFYAHLSKINVTLHSSVKKGETIGIEGGDPSSDPNPGYSTGHHLHFEIRTNTGYGNDINPSSYINQSLF